MSSCRKQIVVEVRFEDQTCKKWCMPLMEDKFNCLISQGDAMVNKVFGSGSLFSPLLFKKFFDPCDAFPLWEFGSDILSSTTAATAAAVQSGGRSSVEWFGTEKEYVLRAELPGNLKKQSGEIVVEKGKIVEISGLWRESDSSKEWRSGNWWEYGYVRRLELPEDADFRKIEAIIKDDIFLEIRIPKINEPNDHVPTN